jgi:hypothetical protein
LEYIMHSGFGDGGSLNVDGVQAVGGAAEGGVVTVKILDSALTSVHLAISGSAHGGLAQDAWTAWGGEWGGLRRADRCVLVRRLAGAHRCTWLS